MYRFWYFNRKKSFYFFKDNVGSAPFLAFVAKGDNCNQGNDQVLFEGNYAHSSMIGWLLVGYQHINDYDTSDNLRECIYGTDFTAFRMWKYGVFSFFETRILHVSQISAIECKHGVYIMSSHYDDDEKELTIEDSVFIGQLNPSPECEDEYLDIYDMNENTINTKSAIILGGSYSHGKNYPNLGYYTFLPYLI